MPTDTRYSASATSSTTVPESQNATQFTNSSMSGISYCAPAKNLNVPPIGSPSGWPCAFTVGVVMPGGPELALLGLTVRNSKPRNVRPPR